MYIFIVIVLSALTIGFIHVRNMFKQQQRLILDKDALVKEIAAVMRMSVDTHESLDRLWAKLDHAKSIQAISAENFMLSFKKTNERLDKLENLPAVTQRIDLLEGKISNFANQLSVKQDKPKSDRK